MNRLLVIACTLVGLSLAIVAFPEGAVAFALALCLVSIVVVVIRARGEVDKEFLITVFLLALLARLGFGLLITALELQSFFGGDYKTYDAVGNALMNTWFGYPSEIEPQSLASRLNSVGWGMYFLTAGIYSLVGRNPVAAQLFCAVIGAATAPLAYVCSHGLFGNKRVGKWSAYLVALYPAFVVWSGQLLKDGLIIFFLVLTITMVLEVHKKISYVNLALLLLSLGAILSLRSYIFYMVAVAVVGMFFVGLAKSQRAMIASFLGLVVVGVAFTYLGGLQSTSQEIEKFTDLEQVQRSRMDLARSAESGFNQDIDVSTTAGALQAIPIGFIYLLFAPFPWEMTNLRQFLALPDVILWWICIPFVVSGIAYSLRHKLRETLGILVFTLMLTLAYSIFQGNVGTAYRQRTQIQVFLFMFAAVGITLRIEKRENAEYLKQLRQEQFEKNYRERERLRVTGV
ncbi:MAG: glycosyltransferase family 39 protein [Aridibacter famidurans]|nr:glycosyltransferase family 39 protein [Aridibacter famidurans]